MPRFRYDRNRRSSRRFRNRWNACNLKLLSYFSSRVGSTFLAFLSVSWTHRTEAIGVISYLASGAIDGISYFASGTIGSFRSTSEVRTLLVPTSTPRDRTEVCANVICMHGEIRAKCFPRPRRRGRTDSPRDPRLHLVIIPCTLQSGIGCSTSRSSRSPSRRKMLPRGFDARWISGSLPNSFFSTS